MILFAAQWSNLKQQNIHTQGYRFATSTRKNVLSQIRQWVYFATYFSLAILPASAEDLCMFAECLSLSSGYGHIKNVISGVRYFHHTMGHTFPTDSVRLEDTLQGLKRKLKGTPKQVLPIGPVILRRMFKNVNLKKNLDLAHWCGCLIAFYTLFRKANLCPKEKKFDPETLLTRGDIILDKVDKRVLIFVNFAKNNQFQKQCHVVPIPSNKDPALDLYTHLCELFERVDADEDSPALSHSSKSFLTHKTFTTRLKFLIESAGLDPALFSGHSFRRGGASYLYSIGGTTLMVQTLGCWSSQVFTRYLYLSLEDRLSAQELIASNINTSVGNITLPKTLL